MAKASSTPSTDQPSIEIHAYKPAPKDIPYAAHVQALIDAKQHFPEGEYPATTVRVPNGDKNEKDEYMGLAKHKRYIQDAAKAAGFSAKILSEEDYGDGTTAVEFGLRDAIKRARKPRTDETGTVSDEDVHENQAA